MTSFEIPRTPHQNTRTLGFLMRYLIVSKPLKYPAYPHVGTKGEKGT